jgi:hypothetical protein
MNIIIPYRRTALHAAVIGLLALCPFFALPALAAEMDVDASAGTIASGGTFEAVVSLDTQGETVNAAEGTLTYPQDLLEPVAIRDADAAIDFWAVRPKIGAPGAIAFSGVAPGGFKSDEARLFEVTFRAKQDGRAAIGLTGAEALLNDGQGTAAALSTRAFTITVLPAASQPPMPAPTQTSMITPQDTTPPEAFEPTIAKSEQPYGNRWFLVFAAQDKQSGIDRYEVRETPPRVPAALSPWVPAESPYLLRDQTRKSRIEVKAIDRSGNVRIASVATGAPELWYIWPLLWLVAIAVFAVFDWRFLPSLRRKRR